jgi:hypothetical protein
MELSINKHNTSHSTSKINCIIVSSTWSNKGLKKSPQNYLLHAIYFFWILEMANQSPVLDKNFSTEDIIIIKYTLFLIFLSNYTNTN